MCSCRAWVTSVDGDRDGATAQQGDQRVSSAMLSETQRLATGTGPCPPCRPFLWASVGGTGAAYSAPRLPSAPLRPFMAASSGSVLLCALQCSVLAVPSAHALGRLILPTCRTPACWLLARTTLRAAPGPITPATGECALLSPSCLAECELAAEVQPAGDRVLASFQAPDTTGMPAGGLRRPNPAISVALWPRCLEPEESDVGCRVQRCRIAERAETSSIAAAPPRPTGGAEAAAMELADHAQPRRRHRRVWRCRSRHGIPDRIARPLRPATLWPQIAIGVLLWATTRLDFVGYRV